jgi:hypothetical protein
MAENKEDIEFLGKLALIADASQNIIDGKLTVVYQLKKIQFLSILEKLNRSYQENLTQFSIDISGIEFIFVLEM